VGTPIIKDKALIRQGFIFICSGVLTWRFLHPNVESSLIAALQARSVSD